MIIRKSIHMETTKTDHSLQIVLSGIRMWKMRIRPMVVSALKREVDVFGESRLIKTIYSPL